MGGVVLVVIGVAVVEESMRRVSGVAALFSGIGSGVTSSKNVVI